MTIRLSWNWSLNYQASPSYYSVQILLCLSPLWWKGRALRLDKKPRIWLNLIKAVLFPSKTCAFLAETFPRDRKQLIASFDFFWCLPFHLVLDCTLYVGGCEQKMVTVSTRTNIFAMCNKEADDIIVKLKDTL